MTIKETASTLRNLADVARETLAEEMTEVPLVAVTREDAEAIGKAAIMLDAVAILEGIFKDKPTP